MRTSSRNKARFVIAVMLSTLSVTFAATRAELTREEFAEDLAVLRATMENAHPSIYRYTSRERMDELFDEAERGLRDGMGLVEFQRAIAPPIAAIRCSHTSWELPRPAFGAFMSTGRFLPLSVKFLGERLFIRKNLSGDASAPVGAEILAINGVPTQEVVGELFRFMRADGQGTGQKYRALERMFVINYRMYVGDPATYELDLVADGERESREFAALPYGELRRNAAQAADPPREEGPLLSLTEPAMGDTALLRIKTFSEATLVRAGLDYEAFLEDAFQRIEDGGLHHLILDLRDNEGGDDDFGSLLFSYLIEEPTLYYAAHTFRAQSYADFEATDLLDNPVFQEFAGRLGSSEELPPLKDILEEMVRVGWDHGPITPREPCFVGRIYILMNGFTGSTAAEVVTMTKLHTAATLIGGEAAGAQVGCNGGLFATLTLPHSKIVFRVPVFRYQNAVPSGTAEGQCPQPDHRIVPTIEQHLNGEDLELATALQLIAAE